MVDNGNQALRRVILVAQKCAVTLKGFKQDGRNDRDIMDGEYQNPLKIIWYESWLLHFEVRSDSKTMLVKQGSNLNHVQPLSVTNERALNSFVWDEVILPTEIQYKQCKRRVKHVRDGQVEQLHN